MVAHTTVSESRCSAYDARQTMPIDRGEQANINGDRAQIMA